MPHFQLETWHFLLQMPHFHLETWHFLLQMPHCQLETWHFTLKTSHCQLKTWHFTLKTSHCQLKTWHFQLHLWHFLLPMPRFQWSMPHFQCHFPPCQPPLSHSQRPPARSQRQTTPSRGPSQGNSLYWRSQEKQSRLFGGLYRHNGVEARGAASYRRLGLLGQNEKGGSGLYDRRAKSSLFVNAAGNGRFPCTEGSHPPLRQRTEFPTVFAGAADQLSCQYDMQ